MARLLVHTAWRSRCARARRALGLVAAASMASRHYIRVHLSLAIPMFWYL
jgi:hypothetical protein